MLGHQDRIEVDLNFLFRLPIGKPEACQFWQPGDLDRPLVRMVSIDELLIGKMLALLDRGAVRDVWDIAHLTGSVRDAIKTPRFRRRFIPLSATLVRPLQTYSLKRLRKRVTDIRIQRELVPTLMIERGADVENVVHRAWETIAPLLQLTSKERTYLEAIEIGDLRLESILSPKEAKLLAEHPALLWKIENVQRHRSSQ